MRRLNRWQTLLMAAGAALMAIGAGCFAAMWHREVACWAFLAGALCFVAMQVLQRYDGADLTIRRLRRIQFFSHALILLAGVSMADTHYHFLQPLFANAYEYVTYAYNKWVALLLAGALTQLYVTYRLGAELGDES